MLLLWALACAPQAADTAPAADPLVVVTFNTGTTAGAVPATGNDGYTDAQAAISDAWYGDGLAWNDAVDAAAAWLAETDPDLVAFQEMFWSGACPDIPTDAHAGFVCDGWQPGDPSVAEVVLGPDYAIGCHPGKPDKCLAVHQRVGSLRGCSAGLCLDALDGFTVDGCGSGARVARAVIDRVDGSALTVVSVHGSSGVATDDEACRVAQVEQVFVDLGDGEPGANGVTHLILGDLNTDPGRWAEIDASAARWNDFVSDSQPFHFITAVGPDAPGSYAGLADIDHVISDNLDGDCWHAGVDDGEPVFTTAYFDHVPAVCTL